MGAASRITTDAYERMAQRHRPADPEQLACEIRRLHGTGLTARDIATALRLAPELVINILGSDAGLPISMVMGDRAGELDRQLSLVERRIIELQHGLRLLQSERFALLQQLQHEARRG